MYSPKRYSPIFGGIGDKDTVILDGLLPHRHTLCDILGTSIFTRTIWERENIGFKEL